MRRSGFTNVSTSQKNAKSYPFVTAHSAMLRSFNGKPTRVSSTACRISSSFNGVVPLPPMKNRTSTEMSFPDVQAAKSLPQVSRMAVWHPFNMSCSQLLIPTRSFINTSFLTVRKGSQADTRHPCPVPHASKVHSTNGSHKCLVENSTL